MRHARVTDHVLDGDWLFGQRHEASDPVAEHMRHAGHGLRTKAAGCPGYQTLVATIPDQHGGLVCRDAGLRGAVQSAEGPVSCEASETLVSVVCPSGGAPDGAKCAGAAVGLCLKKP